MNYFYVEENTFILGVTNLTSADELKKIIPTGRKFYFYKAGDDLEIIAQGTPAGTGAGTEIEITL